MNRSHATTFLQLDAINTTCLPLIETRSYLTDQTLLVVAVRVVVVTPIKPFFLPYYCTSVVVILPEE